MRLQTVSKLDLRDRIALRFLRDPARCDTAPQRAAFVALGTHARNLGGAILALDNDYASQAELCLLGLIANVQREQPVVACAVAPGLRAPIAACASALSAHDLQLGYPTAMRLMKIADDRFVIGTRPFHRDYSARREAPVSPMARTPRATAVDVVRQHGVATSQDLRRAGISGQATNQLLRRGLIGRLPWGTYYAIPGSDG